MSAFSDFIVGLLKNSIESVGESKLEDVLQKLHDKNVDDYKAAIFAGNTLVKHLDPVVAESANKIDDALLGAVKEAVEKSAAVNGITLE